MVPIMYSRKDRCSYDLARQDCSNIIDFTNELAIDKTKPLTLHCLGRGRASYLARLGMSVKCFHQHFAYSTIHRKDLKISQDVARRSYSIAMVAVAGDIDNSCRRRGPSSS